LQIARAHDLLKAEQNMYAFRFQLDKRFVGFPIWNSPCFTADSGQPANTNTNDAKVHINHSARYENSLV
jgi:hypothetical protein